MASKYDQVPMDVNCSLKRLPCRNFVRGFCPSGKFCKLYHPQAMASIMNVPPLPPHFSTPRGFYPNSSKSGRCPVPNPSSDVYSMNSVLNLNAPEFAYRAPSPTNTMFIHIDWSTYLAPGFLPPSPIVIKIEGSAVSSPAKSAAMKSGDTFTMTNTFKNHQADVENMNRLTKMEFHLKMQKIAKELADEAAQAKSLEPFNRFSFSNGSLLDDDK